MTASIPQAITFQVPLSQIDDPKFAMRVEMNDDAMRELMDSIQSNGLLQAIGVKPRTPSDLEIIRERVGRGEDPFFDGAVRCEVVYGHRRTLAHRFLERERIEAKVYLDVNVKPEALKIAENLDREDVTAGEEARFYNDLLREVAGNDVDELCRIVRKSREYVEARLLLLTGDEAVLAAIEKREISFSVGRELNAITSPHLRRMYLDVAIRGGCSTKAAREWRVQANITGQYVDPALAAAAGASHDSAPLSSMAPVCICCGDTKDPHEMSLVYLHGYCKKAILDPLLGGGARG